MLLISIRGLRDFVIALNSIITIAVVTVIAKASLVLLKQKKAEVFYIHRKASVRQLGKEGKRISDSAQRVKKRDADGKNPG